jgi:hypothetical protein
VVSADRDGQRGRLDSLSLDEHPTANALMLKVLDQIHLVSLLPPAPSPAAIFQNDEE